jgi:hypothetical protein
MQPNSQHPTPRLTAEDLEVRIWGFVVIAVTMILCFIVVALLYSVTFVTQPIKSMAPIDQAYTKMLNDIVLLIVGGIGGVMSKRAGKAVANAFGAPPQPPRPPCGMQPYPGQYQSFGPQASTWQSPTQMPNWNWMGIQNPELDETWTPGPPPTTPPDHLEPEHEREELAAARREVG